MADNSINTRAEIINPVEQKGDPYFDRFDSSTDRTKVLFVYDRPLQNAELNEVQSVFSYYMGGIGNMVAKDGDMQQGMGYTQNGNNITVKDGLVYLAGKVRNFKQQTVTIKGTGVDNIGVRLVQSKVTYQDDNSLVGIAPNQESTNKAGADRLVETVELVANDDAAATIYKFNDGKLFLVSDNSQLSKINEIVAQHDFDALGSYRVGSNNSQGFTLSVGQSLSGKADYATVNIAAGRAYVQGYLVDKPYASQIDIRKALDTEQIKNEQHVYIKDTDTYTLSLDHVKTIDLVSAQVQDDISVTHSMSGGSDYVVDNLISVDLVYTSGGKQWTQGKDFNVQGNSIIWNGASGSQPAVGSNYMVKATYSKVLQDNGIDFISSINADTGTATIDFSKGKGNGNRQPAKPKVNGYITVTYTAYLYRIDVVTLDRYGDFTIIEGKPDRKYIAQAPIVNDPLTLTIGTVMMYPNSSNGSCTTNVDTNLTFKDLNMLKRRLIRQEYNNAINSLNSQELQKHDPTALRGAYTDSFVSPIKFNDTYETSSNVKEPFKANINMNTIGRYITLPYSDQSPADLLFNSDKSIAQMLNTNGHLLTARFTEVPMIEQSIVSSTINVNRFDIASFEGILNLDPNADHWATDNVINHYNTTVNNNWTRTGTSGSYTNIGSTKPSSKPNYHEYWQQGYYSQFHVADDGTWIPYEDSWQAGRWISEGTTYDDPIYDSTNDTQTIKKEVLDPVNDVYMRSRDIKFSVVGLAPYADNLELYFGGVKCDIKPDTGYSIGSSAKGSIMALSDGSAKGTFTIPADTIRCGTVDVELKALNNTAHASYTASGTHRDIKQEITPVHNTYWHYDPVAESFMATMDAQITSVDLKFATKSNTTGVTVQLREMVNGTPTANVRASTYLAPTDIKVSSDGSVWTTAHFNDPVPIAKGEYLAISVVSSSNDYALWQGKLGEVIKGTKTAIMGGELYTEGVMFESSNNDTWTADQTSDLAFRVNVAKYSTEPCIAIFDPISNVKASEFALLATYLTPGNTECTWEYRAIFEGDSETNIENKPWQAVTTDTLNQMANVITTLQLRAIFKATQYVSPLLSLSSLMFGKYLSALRGDYVTLNIDSSDSPFNTIYLSYIENTPASSKVVPQYSIDEGKTWVDFTSTPEKKQTDGYGSNKVSYTEKLSGSLGKEIMFHLKLTTTKETQRPLVAQFMASWTQE